MSAPGISIKRKIMRMIMLSSITVLLLTIASFMSYDVLTFRDGMVRNLSTLAQIMADQSSAALAFRNDKDAMELLASLHAEPQVVAAALYDNSGKLFVKYPASTETNLFPASPETPGYRFGHRELAVYEPVFQDHTRLGTLYLKADLRIFYQRVEVYAVTAGLIVLSALLVTLILSHQFQKQISGPILSLAGTAKQISEGRDFSVRATRLSDDELGLLTDAFNRMLTHIEEQTMAIQERETRLRLALGASRTGAWDWNMQTGEVIWDDSNVVLFGIKPGEFKGTYEHFMSFVHPDDQKQLGDALTRAVEQKSEFSIEFRAIWPDGSVHDLMAHGKALYNSLGKPVRMSGITQDITERKLSEEASRRLGAIVESSDDAIIGLNATGIITNWNKGAEHLFQFSAKEAVGRSISIIIPEQRQAEEKIILGRVAHGEFTEHYETVRQRKDGSPVEVSITVSPIRDAAGKIIGASKISRDISQQKQAQIALERQATILREQAQMLDLANVMARDLDDNIILWNTGMEKMYGWLRTETLGHQSHTILQTRFPKPFEEIRAILLRDGEWTGELIHTHKQGHKLIVNSQWVLHKDPKGIPAAILEINTDITERKQAEKQILKLNTELEQRVADRTAELTNTNHELEAFTYSVAHDLRAPLRHIDAFTKIIFDDFGGQIPEEARGYLENIRKGSQNMSRLVDDLLNLARVGRQELKRERVHLNPVVSEVIRDLAGEIERREVEWHIEKLPEVESDPGLIKQVFANLLSNAVKYTRPRKKAIIEIGQRQLNDEIAIYVHDNGVGFNMKYADKLFGVFQRLHRSDEFEGTGVGLATVERIVRKHGGRIWAEAEVEKGATFYFTVNGLSESNSHANS
jgi:PAS domain S-box-containing protein